MEINDLSSFRFSPTSSLYSHVASHVPQIMTTANEEVEKTEGIADTRVLSQPEPTSSSPTPPAFIAGQAALFVLAMFTFGTSNAKKIAQVMGLEDTQIAQLESYIAGLSEADQLPLDLPQPMTWGVLLSKRTKKMCTRFLMNKSRMKRVQELADKELSKDHAVAVSNILILFKDGYVDCENYIESLIIMLGRNGTVDALNLPEFLTNIRDVEDDVLLSPTAKKRGLSSLFRMDSGVTKAKQAKKFKASAPVTNTITQMESFAAKPRVALPTKICFNCNCTQTPLWRKEKTLGVLLCNACGIYYKNHGTQRPLGLSTKPKASTKEQPASASFVPSKPDPMATSISHQLAAHATLKSMVPGTSTLAGGVGVVGGVGGVGGAHGAGAPAPLEPSNGNFGDAFGRQNGAATRRSSRPKKPKSSTPESESSDYSVSFGSLAGFGNPNQHDEEKMRGDLISKLTTTVPVDVDGAVKGLWAMKEATSGNTWGSARVFADGAQVAKATKREVPNAYSQASYGGSQTCANCSTSSTPLWRRCRDTGDMLCNACGIYRKTHGTDRPLGKVKRRSSVSQSGPAIKPGLASVEPNAGMTTAIRSVVLVDPPPLPLHYVYIHPTGLRTVSTRSPASPDKIAKSIQALAVTPKLPPSIPRRDVPWPVSAAAAPHALSMIPEDRE